MPIFEYVCKCGNRMEVIFLAREKITNKKKCDDCGCMAEKVISAGAFHLYGDGWTAGLEENKSWEERRARREQRLPGASDEDIRDVRRMMSGRAPAVQDGYTEHNE
jgi:putative FmdB family regulatory protein